MKPPGPFTVFGNQAYLGAGHVGIAWFQSFVASTYASQFVRVYGAANRHGTAHIQTDVMNVTCVDTTDFLF